MTTPSIILTISHYIHLTRDERYRWYNGETLDVIGVSTPVWFYKNQTSEPGMEVFCHYRLLTDPEGAFVKHKEHGYDIKMPKNPTKNEEQEIEKSILKLLTPLQIETMQSKDNYKVSLRDILDIKDGGSEFVCFNQYNRIEKNDRLLSLVHYVEIKDMNELMISLIL